MRRPNFFGYGVAGAWLVLLIAFHVYETHALEYLVEFASLLAFAVLSLQVIGERRG